MLIIIFVAINIHLFIFILFNKKDSKKPEFHADFKSVKKVFKKCTKKSYKQNKFEEHE